MSEKNSETKITIEYEDTRTAKAIQSAITPDNITVPDGMHIIVAINGSKLEIEVFSDRSIGSLVATLDDLLSCIQAAEKAIHLV